MPPGRLQHRDNATFSTPALDGAGGNPHQRGELAQGDKIATKRPLPFRAGLHGAEQGPLPGFHRQAQAVERGKRPHNPVRGAGCRLERGMLFQGQRFPVPGRDENMRSVRFRLHQRDERQLGRVVDRDTLGFSFDHSNPYGLE